MAESGGVILIFVGAAFILGLIAGLLTGLLLRRNQLQRLQGALRVHLKRRTAYTKAKLSDDDLMSDADLWSGAVSDDDDSHADNVDEDDGKMVLCVRTDLQMGKGKIAAQCGHAVLGLYQRCVRRNYAPLQVWERQGQAKVVLKVINEYEMNKLYAAATQQKLPAFIVYDAGRTQIPGGSSTVLAIGPASSVQMDRVTGHLKLL